MGLVMGGNYVGNKQSIDQGGINDSPYYSGFSPRMSGDVGNTVVSKKQPPSPSYLGSQAQGQSGDDALTRFAMQNKEFISPSQSNQSLDQVPMQRNKMSVPQGEQGYMGRGYTQEREMKSPIWQKQWQLEQDIMAAQPMPYGS